MKTYQTAARDGTFTEPQLINNVFRVMHVNSHEGLQMVYALRLVSNLTFARVF